MNKKKCVKSEMAKRGSIGGKRSAARLTAQERTARARRAAEMRYGRERERDEAEARAVVARLMKADASRMSTDPDTAPHRLVIFRDGTLVGVVEIGNVKLTLHAPDTELEGLYKTALDPGVQSLGRMDTLHEPGGPIIEEMNWTKLVADDIGSVYVFAHELASHGYTCELTRAIVPKPRINPKFIAVECHATPMEGTKRPQIVVPPKPKS